MTGKPGGLDLGGEDFDERLYGFLGRQLDPGEWELLTQADSDLEWDRRRYHFKNDVCRAKERLSKHSTAHVYWPNPGDLRVSRSDFEGLIRDAIESTVDELERTITGAGQTVAGLSAVYLAGGSSRIPLVAQLIEERLGRKPSVFGDPQTATVLGAARLQRAAAYSTG